MALKRLPYDEAALLLRDYLSTQEDEETAALIRALRPARTRGYLTPSELEKVCRWKSARAIRYIKGNSASRVRSATRRALATRSERKRPTRLKRASSARRASWCSRRGPTRITWRAGGDRRASRMNRVRPCFRLEISGDGHLRRASGQDRGHLPDALRDCRRMRQGQGV